MHHTERLTYGFIFLILVLIGAAVWFLVVPHTKTTQVFLGNTTYSMTVVKDDAARDQALQQDDALSGNKGVMVAYPEAGTHTISLKNLREKSDVLWLDSEKKIIYQKKNLPVLDIDKEFGPTTESRYVLIFRGGIITQQKILTGNTIDFDLNSLW